MEGKFHINPETGNPNRCRAKKRCPFGGESAHFATPAEAREDYERQVERSGVRALQGVRLSKGARLLFALDRAQTDLRAFLGSVDPYGQRSPEEEKIRWEKITHRNGLEERLRKLPWDSTDAPAYDSTETVTLTTDTFKAAEDRDGYSNDWFTPGEREERLYAQLDRASTVWLKRLSTAEVKAVLLYNLDAEEYAKAMSGEPAKIESEQLKYFHSALAKAPRTAEPFRAYAGISRERVAAVREQCFTGQLTLERVQSASANPAQVNGFMFRSDWDGPNDETAVEFESRHVASLSAFNTHRGEMELLIPPGEYAVVATHSEVGYYWPGLNRRGEKSGRVSDTTFVVKEIEG